MASDNTKTKRKNNKEKQQHLDLIIVGGGLSGLVIAREIVKYNNKNQHLDRKTWRLLEANSSLGGRLQNDDKGHSIDMGGAWIWPRYQPLMKNLVQELNLDTFLQPDDHSSTRIVGGAFTIIDYILREIQEEAHEFNCILKNCPVVSCKKCESVIEVQVSSGSKLTTEFIVFAIPPKLLSMNVQFDPPLSNEKRQALLSMSCSTWMAGVTKISLIFNTSRFWPIHESNKSFFMGPGKPAFQVYDGSPNDNSLSVLTFFALPTLSDQVNDDQVLAKLCMNQFCDFLSSRTIEEYPNIAQRLLAYDMFHVKHWSREKFISENSSPTVIKHPEPDHRLAASEWEGSLFFAGTETDQSSPGVMEGAVGAATRAFNQLVERWTGDD